MRGVAFIDAAPLVTIGALLFTIGVFSAIGDVPPYALFSEHKTTYPVEVSVSNTSPNPVNVTRQFSINTLEWSISDLNKVAVAVIMAISFACVTYVRKRVGSAGTASYIRFILSCSIPCLIVFMLAMFGEMKHYPFATIACGALISLPFMFPFLAPDIVHAASAIETKLTPMPDSDDETPAIITNGWLGMRNIHRL